MKRIKNTPGFNEDTPFNMAKIFLERLDRRQEEAQLYKRDVDLYGWFRTLENIYDMIHVFILQHNDKTADEEILSLFDKARIRLNNLRHKLNVSQEELTLSELNEQLRGIYRKLNALIYKYEMLLPHRPERLTISEQMESAFEPVKK